MEKIALPGATVSTSRLGLGCGRLIGGTARKESVKLVNVALEAGIRHFDVAPSYGLGLAEATLGDALSGCRDCTIATKVGIAAPKGGEALSRLRGLVRPFVSGLPKIKARLAELANTAVPAAAGRFEADQISHSLSNSLNNLRRDRVDALLLHEPPFDVGEEIIELLERLQATHLIGSYGAGIGRSYQYIPAIGSIAQFAWEPAQKPPSNRTHILHGVFRQWLPKIEAALRVDRLSLAAASRQLEFDLAQPQGTAAFLLSAVMMTEPHALVLISTQDPVRLQQLASAIDWNCAAGRSAAFNAGVKALFGEAGLLTATPNGTKE